MIFYFTKIKKYDILFLKSSSRTYRTMKKNIMLVSVLLSNVLFAEIVIDTKGFVTFESQNLDNLGILTPNKKGFSFPATSGKVYFHHQFSGNGEDFQILDLLISVDPDGDGIYTDWMSVKTVSTPGSGNPLYVLKRDGITLTGVKISNSVVDEVLVLNHQFLLRTMKGGVKWKLVTAFGEVVQQTTHEIIPNFSNLTIKNYEGEATLFAEGSAGDVVEASYNLINWFEFYSFPSSQIQILQLEEFGQPRKFFRIRKAE